MSHVSSEWESCHRCVTYEWVMSHMNESCLTWMSHVSYEWVTSYMNESCLIWQGFTEEVQEHLKETYYRDLQKRPIWMKRDIQKRRMNIKISSDRALRKKCKSLSKCAPSTARLCCSPRPWPTTWSRSLFIFIRLFYMSLFTYKGLFSYSSVSFYVYASLFKSRLWVSFHFHRSPGLVSAQIQCAPSAARQCRLISSNLISSNLNSSNLNSSHPI